jgi:hypothetical protein
MAAKVLCAMAHAMTIAPPIPSFHQATITPSVELVISPAIIQLCHVQGSGSPIASAMLINNQNAVTNALIPRAIQCTRLAARALPLFVFTTNSFLYPPFIYRLRAQARGDLGSPENPFCAYISMASTSSWNPISGSGPDMGNQSLDDWVPLEV